MPAFALPHRAEETAHPKSGAVFFVVAGILPVTSIALHCGGFIPLTASLLFITLPAIGIAFALNALNRAVLRRVLSGWIAGIIAVALYDLSRIPFVYAGWDDFIPHIASWLTGKNDHAYLISYSWRYIGNGGGLGITFFLLADYFQWKKYSVSAGVSFGLLVFAGLLGLLILIPQSQKLMFEVTPLSFTGGLVGHVVYGYVLGKLNYYFNRGMVARLRAK